MHEMHNLMQDNGKKWTHENKLWNVDHSFQNKKEEEEEESVRTYVHLRLGARSMYIHVNSIAIAGGMVGAAVDTIDLTR